MSSVKTKDLTPETPIVDTYGVVTTKNAGTVPTVQILFSTIKAWIKAWIVKADVGLGSVDNTADSAKNVLSATKLTTARTINGTSFDGTANVVLTERVGSDASSATPTINVDTTDCYKITALAAAITGITITGTPADFQALVIRIKDNGTARGITMGSSFVAMGASLPTTTVVNKLMHIVCIYDSVQTKWGVTAVIQEA